MTITSVAQWSTDQAQNTNIAGNNIDEGCSPAGINNAIRYVMAQAKAQFDTIGIFDFDTVALLIADTARTYSNTTAGDYIRTRAEGFAYEVAASGASDHHITTGGGLKLYVATDGDVVNVKAFGAVGDGTTDDTAEIQAAITFAGDNARALYIPGDSYKISSTLNVVKRIRIFGDGMWQSLLVYTGAGVALQVSPPAGGSHNTGYAFHDFGVKPSVDGGGTFGIDVYLATGAYFSNWEMARVYIGDFGNYGLHLDNGLANADGFFTCTIRRCWIHNGINGVSLGDSITICENTITGSRLTLPGILISGLSGARQLVLRENNITTQAGAIALNGVEQPQILFNQIEHPAYIGNYTGPYDAIVWLNNVSLGLIQGNTISPAAGSCVSANYALFFESTSTYNTIDGNNISKGEVYHVAFNTTSTFNVLRKNNTYDATPVILNVPVNNLGVYVDLTPVNSWVTYTTGTGIAVKRDEGGKIFVRGALKDGTITTGTILTTLPVGFRPTREKRFQTTNYNGSAYSSATLEVNTSGEIIVRLAAANNMLHLDGICFDEE